MRLSQKVGKLTNRKALQSALRHLLARRASVPLDPAGLIGTIDTEKFEQISRRHAIDGPGKAWPKILRSVALDEDQPPPHARPRIRFRIL